VHTAEPTTVGPARAVVLAGRLGCVWALAILLLLGGFRPGVAAARPADGDQGAAIGDLPLADEQELLGTDASSLRVFRLKPAPQIMVMIFPTLLQQGLTLNRVGAFVEQAGLPRDHVLDDSGLTRAIAAAHVTVETYYYGHDYSAADLLRFFETARSDGIALSPEEKGLEHLLQRENMLELGANAALITLPPPGNTPLLDPQARAAILRHEIAHGVFFTDPTYVTYVRHFWQTVMNSEQRAHFRHFLGSEGYDTTNETLILDETQAYLVHTPDPRFFNAAAVGMPPDDVADLRHKFVADMPDSWLRRRTPDSATPGSP
jgi:hypothetical protein